MDIGIAFQLTRFSVEQPSPEPRVKVMIPMYEPLETSTCRKCGKIIAEPKELVKIVKNGKDDSQKRAAPLEFLIYAFG